MVWRSVIVSRPAKLRREHFSLVIDQEQSARVPFEDIAVIVLDHREITLTHPVLAACGEYGIGLYSTGPNHHPNGVFTAFLGHTRATRMLRLQLAVDKPRTKRAWAAVVRAKIANQAACLRLAGHSETEWLDSLTRRVKSGDAGRLEGQAAAHYFPRLFGRAFDRNQESWTNAALDYGYAILRGAIARCLVAHGLLPSIGIFHASEQNAFNLADDLIEPFRPLVDLFVAMRIQRGAPTSEELLHADKAGLVSLLNVDVRTADGEMSTLSAIEYCVESFQRLLEAERGQEHLLLPSLVGLRQHVVEGS